VASHSFFVIGRLFVRGEVLTASTLPEFEREHVDFFLEIGAGFMNFHSFHGTASLA